MGWTIKSADYPRTAWACEKLLAEDEDGDVAIDEEVLAAVVHAALEAGVQPHCSARMPLKFDDRAHEVNYTCLLHCLDFGSSYNDMLLQKMGRTSRECVEFGLMSLHLDGRNMDARYLANFSKQNVFTYFGVDATVEEEVRPGIMLTKAGPLAGWVDKVASVLQALGKATLAAGQPSLGAWVLGQLSPARTTESDEGGASGTTTDQPSASELVEWLVARVPGFEDEPVPVPDTDVRFARKAQSLVATLGLPGSETLCLDSGPGALVVLQEAGVIKVQGAAAEALAAGTDLAGTGSEAKLRAAVVRAGVLARELAGQPAAELASTDLLWQLLHEEPTQSAKRLGVLRDLATTAF